ncbi:fibrinogen [Elysia marginata]|uniref:Fibrinogen n=1 Tax=Elysia marginata TaxID=1093978 RepID=A0AAV4EPX6_9GAST|nr:fibrinogen [Elysia marginata]
MKVFLACVCYFFLLSDSLSLELSWNVNSPISSGNRHVCGVLICKESFSTKSTNASMKDLSQDRTIYSISIFKNIQTTLTDSGEILVEALTSAQPTVTRVSNGVKADGFLQKGRAKLQLEFVKEVDCLARYSCEVRTSDSKGNELIQINRIQQQREHKDHTGDALIKSGIFLQQMNLLHQQVAFFQTSLDRKLGDFDDKFDTLDDKIVAFAGKLDVLESKFEGLAKRFENTETRLNFIQVRTEDKLQNVQDQMQNKMETRVVDKLCEIEAKLSHVCVNNINNNNIPQRFDEIEDSLASLKREITDDIKKSISLAADTILNSTSKVISAVQGPTSEILKWEKRNGLQLKNMVLARDKIINSSEDLIYRFQSSFQILNSNFDQLKGEFQNSSSETLSAIRDVIENTNITVWNSLKPAMTHIFSPTECTKGMFPSLLGTAFPYHVIKPDGKSYVNAPFLCDSVTDEGGWIVIQRRSSGNTNFNRNWEEYREGFGNLYEDFWWGNKNIHAITRIGDYELRVDLKYRGKSSYARYSSFSLDGESNNFILRLGAYQGTAGDGLGFHNGKQFSTYDRDNDGRSQNDAAVYSAAWWYYRGYHSNLNGVWGTNGNNRAMTWNVLTGSNSVSFSEMKIRRL